MRGLAGPWAVWFYAFSFGIGLASSESASPAAIPDAPWTSARFVGAGTVRYVDMAASGSNNGTDWANAYNHLQDALSEATIDLSIHEIWVANGIYTPDLGGGQTPLDRAATFRLRSGLALFGGFSGIESAVDERTTNVFTTSTVLSGDLLGDDAAMGDDVDNAFHVVTGSSIDNTSRLDGFVVTSGRAADNNNDGGGLKLFNASPIIVNCRFENNAAVRGGGAFVNSGSPTFVNCVLIGNTANLGGGLAVTGGPVSVNLLGSIVASNVANSFGGGIHANNTTIIATNCTLADNSTGGSGGGLATFGSNVSLTNSVLWKNRRPPGITDQAAQIHVGTSPQPMVNHSVVQGLSGSLGGIGNTSADPYFVSEFNDLRLQPESACIDAGNSSALPLDLLDLDYDGVVLEQWSVDIEGPASPRVLDDPGIVDTGMPLRAAVDIGAFEHSTDCDGDLLEDWYELQLLGLPFDCNLNSVVDYCDTQVYFTSDDDDFNGTPDECGAYVAGCVKNRNWSCPANWSYGGVFPNNTPQMKFAPTIRNNEIVDLDVNVSIDALVIIEGATLNVASSAVRDLTLIKPSGLFLQGTLNVGHMRKVDTPLGLVRINDGGVFQANPELPPESVSGELIAARLNIGPGGSTKLAGTMRLQLSGDLLLDGVAADPCGSGVAGPMSPPAFESVNSAITTVLGNLDLRGSATWVEQSTVPFDLGGHFHNSSVEPGCFDWIDGKLRFISTPMPPAEGHTFEVAGQDVGALELGFFAGGSDNFAIGTLEVMAGRKITFQNRVANTIGNSPCDEALYVHDLTLRTGSTLHLQSRVYYRQKTQESGVSITTSGCGGLVQIPLCTTSNSCRDGAVCTDDVCDLMTGTCSHIPIPFQKYADVDFSGVVELYDILCGLQAYTGNFATCPIERTDIAPCGNPDGLVELTDILNFLSAYSQIPPCPNPCP